MTHGNVDNCKCPYCGKINRRITECREVPFGNVIEFIRPCEHCGKLVYYWCRWSVIVDAEKESKTT